MFETPEIRTSFIDTIVGWIKMSSDIQGEQLEYIRVSLTELSDAELIEAGMEIENFENASKSTLKGIERQVLSVEHTLEEEIEKLEVTPPLFS